MSAFLKSGTAGLTLDINNNNSDAGTGTAFANQYDYLSLDLDGPDDRAEFGTLHPAPSPKGTSAAVVR